ncbi:MAG: biotin/lipoate A/B protein ligase family protein [Sulfolobales archaeon]|jgi:lipoate-protein ligase A|nr:lipoate--protein ligase family protein [Desulfurococcaceae archaeon]
MNVRVIESLIPSDPYMNLAVEEALNNVEVDKPVMRFWVNKPAVVLGRFEDVLSEVNVEYCLSNDVAIVRRHSGGGTVYHDEGNLNITLVLPRSYGGRLTLCYDILKDVLVSTLNSLGLKNITTTSNEVLVNDRKVSGMAGSLTKYSLLCHSTLLVSSDLTKLRSSLRRLKKEVTTLSSEVGYYTTIEEVYTYLIKSLNEVFLWRIFIDDLTVDEVKLAEELYLSKYLRDSWNFKT